MAIQSPSGQQICALSNESCIVMTTSLHSVNAAEKNAARRSPDGTRARCAAPRRYSKRWASAAVLAWCSHTTNHHERNAREQIRICDITRAESPACRLLGMSAGHYQCTPCQRRSIQRRIARISAGTAALDSRSAIDRRTLRRNFPGRFRYASSAGDEAELIPNRIPELYKARREALSDSIFAASSSGKRSCVISSCLLSLIAFATGRRAEHVGAQQHQIHPPRFRNSIGAPFRYGRGFYLEHLGHGRRSAQSINYFGIIHGTYFRHT